MTIQDKIDRHNWGRAADAVCTAARKSADRFMYEIARSSGYEAQAVQDMTREEQKELWVERYHAAKRRLLRAAAAANI